MTANAALAPTSRPPVGHRTRVMATRVASVVAVLGACALLTIAGKASGTASAVGYLAKYSPDRLADGRVWTLPTSAFLLGHPRMIGPTTFFTVLFFLPYVLCRGIVRAGIVAMSGHLLSTLVVAAVVLPAAALGSPTYLSVAHTLDYGASAALAACAGGLVVVIGRRWPTLAGIVLALVTLWFVRQIALNRHPLADVPDVEHLVALATGVFLEWWLDRRAAARAAASRIAAVRPGA
jgi:hypothetical protein